MDLTRGLNHRGHRGHREVDTATAASRVTQVQTRLRDLRAPCGSIFLLLMLLTSILPAQTAPRAGMLITRSTRITPGVYRLAAPMTADSTVITIRGDNITLDMRGVTLIGASLDRSPEQSRGVAIRIDGGRNVRVIGATARGYQTALIARGTRQLTLERNNFSHNWKPELFSLVEHESLADWLSYHHNEKDEWLRFGAGIYLSDVKGGAITGNTVEQGMNGLMLVRTDSLDIRGNDFSFNSGLGIGMYRASFNRIVSNRVDYNVRGYSHGFFFRGQDSADLLMFEQSLHNLVAYNSMTHGGDGLFIWAGQETMDSGQGGVNDNLFLMNDFSFAPTNGMEATFSRNQFIANRVEGSWHGLWGGYSYSSRVIGNCFINNTEAITIEHGQDNVIGSNRFVGNTLGIRLWADSIEPGDWGYPKHRDTRSRDWQIVENRFVREKEPFRIKQSTAFDTTRNTYSDSLGTACDPRRLVPTTTWWKVPQIPAEPRTWPRRTVADRDRSAIIVDEWGPYDWRSPKLWPIDSVRTTPLRLRVLGPDGRWRVRAEQGIASLSRRSGRVGDTLVVTPHADSANDWRVELEYVGVVTTSPRGVRTAAGQPVRFDFAHFEPRTTWHQRVFAWTDSTHPQKQPAAFAVLLRGTPVAERDAPRLDWFWSRPRDKAIPAAHVAMEATAAIVLPSGDYTLRTLVDDAVRVWVDDVLAIDDWTPHETAAAYATLSGGRHEIRVQYVQVDGWTELRLDVLRGRVMRSVGSAGPH